MNTVEMSMCKICNVPLLNEQSKQSHLVGKKHQLALHQKHLKTTREKCGIFVNGISDLSQQEVLDCLSNYGKIVSSFFADKNAFAIIQFNNAEEVTKILSSKIILKDRALNIQRRQIKNVKGHTVIFEQHENFEQINERLKNLSNFKSQLSELIIQVHPNWDEMTAKYRALVCDLENILKKIFPTCVIRPFGSAITRLNFISSDLDIYVEVDKSEVEEEGESSKLVNRSANLLRKYGQIFSEVFAIPKAKTPIVKCLHLPTKVRCDFNFKNMLGVQNTNLICYYLSLDDKLYLSMIVIKYWAKIHELSGSNGKFSNYSLILMLIYFLQQHPYSLPSVFALQNTSGSYHLEESWNCSFRTVEYVSDYISSKSVFEILYDFFDYYANYDYALNVICPYLGKSILKTEFFNSEQLPEEFRRYKANIAKSHSLKVERPICVQDPFEHNHNVISSVPMKVLDELVALCRVGANIFKKSAPDDPILYKLFTDDSESMDYQKYLRYNDAFIFKIPMGNSLIHLNQTISDVDMLDAEEKLVKLRSKWYSLVNEFICTILVNILKFEIDIEADFNEKIKLLNEQLFNENDIIDSVNFHCTGFYNLWETRKSILKDIKSDKSGTLLEQQINLTNYMCELFKDILLNESIIEFNMCMHAKVNPTEIIFILTKINTQQNCFSNFAVFMAKNIPAWFNKHIKELDENVSKAGQERSTENEEMTVVQ